VGRLAPFDAAKPPSSNDEKPSGQEKHFLMNSALEIKIKPTNMLLMFE